MYQFAVNIILSVLLAAALVFDYVLLKWARDLQERLLDEAKLREGNDHNMSQRHYDFVRETQSGFEALGLVRRPARPSTGPYWIKPNEQQKEVA